MNPEEKVLNRQNQLYEHLSSMHMLCVLILMLTFIKYKNMVDIYPMINLRLFTFLSLAGLGVVFLYHLINKEENIQDKPALTLKVRLVYVVFPFLMVLLILFFSGNFTMIESVFVLPVLFAASVTGRKASLLMSTVSSLILVFYPVIIHGEPFFQSLESRVFIISIIYTVGWFVGGLIDIEARHREQLKQSLRTLSEEIIRREMMEKEMNRLDRLNLIGEMAAGIGHEIRNPMTTVSGLLQLMQGKEQYAGDKEFFELMIAEITRSNSIITEFLSLAREKKSELIEQDLNAIIENIYPLIYADAMGSDKDIDKELGQIPNIALDGKEIRQVLLNLARNGMDAMSPGGKLTISTYMENNEVVMAVQDEGCGIAPEVMEKIGTPFFTTKETGTGLGLAICNNIIERHSARMDIKTGPEGTTFSIRFKVN